MAQKDRKVSFLTAIWNRVKYALGNEQDEAADSAKLAYWISFLERCFIQDCLVEKTRKQLERQWQEISN